MISRKKISTINEIQQIQFFATQCDSNVGIHSDDGSIIIDAKSYIGIYALNFNEPILVVCEDKQFHEKIRFIGENI